VSQTPANSELTDLIRTLELELLLPETRRSADRLNELIADDFVEFGSSGRRYTKQDVLRELPAANTVSYALSDFEAYTLTADTIHATYRIARNDLTTGLTSRSLRSSLWQYRDKRWQIVFHQGTPERSSSAPPATTGTP
jgi:hypothetical protein